MLKKHCQVNKQDLCHRRAPSGEPGREPPGHHGLSAPAPWQAAQPSFRDQQASRGPQTRHGGGIDLGTGCAGQERRGRPCIVSGLRSASAEKRVAVPWIGHTVAAVCQASRGVQRCVGPARLQVCARAHDVRGVLSCVPGSPCVQSKTYPRWLRRPSGDITQGRLSYGGLWRTCC